MSPMIQRPSYSDRFRELIRSITGISLPPNKVQMIEQRLRRRVIAFELEHTEDYLQLLLEHPDMEEELRIVIDLITTNTTSFFRESDHFDYLSKVIVPDRLKSSTGFLRPRLKVWSAAASEGAEAFTVAMVLSELQRTGTAFDYAVLGTDISQRMLQRASAAIYDREQLSTIPPELVQRYFMMSRDASMAGKARVVPELRRFVRFRTLNLMDATYPVDRDVDVIFLRNILIYFDTDDKARVIDRLVGHLAPGGYLLVGHAESMVVRHPHLRHVKPTVFTKV